MLQMIKRAIGTVTNAKAGKLKLFPDSVSSMFYTKDEAGIVRLLGNGIASITRTSGTGAEGTDDVYTITRDDGATSTFTVHNGSDGRAIVSVIRTSGTGAAGTTDTYTITYTKAPLTSTFMVTNGANGTGTGTATAASTVGDANTAGTAGPEYANPNHVHAHGSQTNPAHHAVATGSTNGFMSSANFTKLAGIETSATADAASGTAPPAIAAAGAAGTDTNTYANADHTHAHGDQAGGTTHALATASVAGYLAPAQFSTLTTFFGQSVFVVNGLVDGSDAATVSGAQADANTAAIQAAINAASSAVGKKPGGIVLLPAGTFHISSTLTINTSSVQLIGSGRRGNTDVGSQTGTGTTLFWNNTASPATTAMIDVVSPAGIGNAAVKGAGVSSMNLQCAGNVGIGIRVLSIHWAIVRDIYIINATAKAFLTECLITGTTLGEAADVTKCTFDNIGIRMLEVSGTAVGFSLEGAANANTSNSTFRNLAVSCQGAQIALDIRNTDSNRFYDVVINQSNGGTVQPVVLRGAAVEAQVSRGNMFFALATGGSSTGVRGLKSEGTDTAGVVFPAMNNRIFGYSIENGEPGPLIGTGSVLEYQLAGGAAALANRATLANATTTVETVVARWLLPENSFYPGATFMARVYGQASGTATLTYRVRVGAAGTTADPLAIAFTASAAGVANAHTSADLVVACLTAGAAGTVTAGGTCQLAAASLGPATAAFAAATVNTAARLFVSVTLQLSAANAVTIRTANIQRAS